MPGESRQSLAIAYRAGASPQDILALKLHRLLPTEHARDPRFITPLIMRGQFEILLGFFAVAGLFALSRGFKKTAVIPALGITNSERKLYIGFTIRPTGIRIISARYQSKIERGVYEKK